MINLFRFLGKKELDISFIATKRYIYLVFDFKRRRTKFLRGKRIFYARVHTGNISITSLMDELRSWCETITEDYILERLESAPLHYQPVIAVTTRIKIDFNVTQEDVLGAISLRPLSS